MLKEIPVENFTRIPKLIANGANRIELCDNLTVGGTTVSRGVMAETQKYANEHNIPVMAMIRPRGGNFIYNDTEIKMMETDIFQAQELGVDGVVLGALTKDNKLDTEALEQLIAAAGGMQITFHMAFDEIKDEAKFESIDWLVEQGIDRILTHGNSLDSPIEENLDKIQSYIKYANGRIIILPGGGITAENAEYIQENLKVNELHGSKLI